MSTEHPHDPPPTYEAATTSSPSSSTYPNPNLQRVSTDGPAARTTRNGIPPSHRRSMEDENRPLPPGWIRQFDPIEQHQFFVDTKSSPPRSIWTHPYDDPDFLSTLSPEEQKKYRRLHRSMTLNDLAAEDTDPEDEGSASSSVRKHTSAGAGAGAQLPARGDPEPTGLHKFGRKMKDRITSTTHTEREAERARRAEEERRAYVMHLRAREALQRACDTGVPQYLGKDSQNRDVYVEPPVGYYRGGGGYGGGYGYSPYATQGRFGGPYADPNARFLRPAGPYGGRPYGYGYGGGLGVPVAAGLLGGAVLGGLLF